MKKTFILNQEGKNRDRVVEAVKNEVRKYQQREQRKALPVGVDYWDFDCKVGTTAETADALHVAGLRGSEPFRRTLPLPPMLAKVTMQLTASVPVR